MDDYILQMKNICKEFPGVKALNSVSINVKKGEVHCLMGENGAGKSTLIKILAGAYSKDNGEIIFDGNPIVIQKPNDSLKAGISFIFQELSVVPAMTVEENINLGYEIQNHNFVDRKKNIQKVQEVLKDLNIKINPEAKVRNLTASQKQMMLIAKAISHNAKLIVMDEPTAALTEKETNELFHIVRRLKKDGVSFILVSHRFEDVFSIGDSVTVFRDGENVGYLNVKETNNDELIQLMIGRSLEGVYPYEPHDTGETILEFENVNASDLLKNVSFTLKKGEVLGVSGLAGAGKTELARCIFGVNPIISGKVFLHGKETKIKNPISAMKHKIALLPEERRSEGIVGTMGVRENISLACGKKIEKRGMVSLSKDRELAEKCIQLFRIATPGQEQKIKFLSGGNQQKVIVAKWMNTDADIILLDEPTRGIDVGAKREIYDIMSMMVKNGKSIIMFSSELPELLGMCDEIIVFSEGKLMGSLPRAKATQEEILRLSVGGI